MQVQAWVLAMMHRTRRARGCIPVGRLDNIRTIPRWGGRAPHGTVKPAVKSSGRKT
jgi:hypothetical protein